MGTGDLGDNILLNPRVSGPSVGVSGTGTAPVVEEVPPEQLSAFGDESAGRGGVTVP